jgi:hypothetical protein
MSADEATRRRIATQAGVPRWWDVLKGETEPELAADAVRIATKVEATLARSSARGLLRPDQRTYGTAEEAISAARSRRFGRVHTIKVRAR